jgi:hypothetical protein
VTTAIRYKKLKSGGPNLATVLGVKGYGVFYMYEKLFEPGRIGKLHLKNRIAMAAMLL